MEVLDGQKLATPFLDISGDVKSGGEQGLLSMAFAPDYASSGRFYVYYTAPRAGDSGGSVITVREYIGHGDTADPATGRTVFTVDHPTNSNHNGGQLEFGPDGLLYAGTGDGGSGNDPPNNAQNLGSNLGKLLRVDPLGGGQPSLYAYGLRNPFRFSFDRGTGNLVIGDVGQNMWEEVDFSPAGTPAGRNYGWHCREGMHDTPGVTCTAPGAVDPVLEKDHSTTGFCAIIGGYVVRDASLGSLAGRYVYGDNCASPLRSVTLPGATDDAATGLDVTHLTSFGEDSCGHVYAASGDGPVYRIDGDAFTPCPESAPPGGTTPPPGGGTTTPPPPGGGTTTPPDTTPPDTTPPVLQVSSGHAQHALRNHGFRLAARCNELCGLTVTGTVWVAGSRRQYKLTRFVRQIAAGQRIKFTVRAPRATLRAIRSALARHRRVTATVVAAARDAAGNKAGATRRIRVVA
jgi:hypothetical protein